MFSKEEAKQLRKEFWESFSNYTKFYSRKVGEPLKWMLYKTGIKGLELKFDLEDKLVRVVLELNSRSEDRRFDMFVELDAYKKIIENGFNEELIWADEFILPEGKVVSRVYIELEEIKYHNRDNWPELFKFMAKNMYQLQLNFLDIEPIFKNKFGSGLS